ncbi:MAG: RNA polymerase II mediator complex subunit [Claussenomyces sp. TS43310]|nr:MAG: RNA polymerase II mediator complex subunit [Claussenomyces sp. TS43310]
MARTGKVEQEVLEAQLQNIVQDLYELMVQASAYDNVGPGVQSRDVLVGTIEHLHQSLTTIHQTAATLARDPARDVRIPPELIQYVDAGRNPDIYTREFVELARRGNQLMRGKQAAFAAFRNTLAAEMTRGLPELDEDVRRVVEATGGGGGSGAGVEPGVGAGPGAGAGHDGAGAGVGNQVQGKSEVEIKIES